MAYSTTVHLNLQAQTEFLKINVILILYNSLIALHIVIYNYFRYYLGIQCAQ